VIDATAFVGRWPFYPEAHGDAASLLAMMQEQGIERALVSPLGSVFFKDPEEGNEELWRAVEVAKGCLLPVPCVDPTYPGWRRTLERSLEQGALGIRLYPNYHSYAVNGEVARALAAECGARRLLLMVTMRLQDERQHHRAARLAAVKVAEVAELARYGEGGTRLVVSFARLGEILALVRLLPSERLPWCDVAGVQGPEKMWEQLTSAGMGHRLLFGSGWPLQYETVGAAKVKLMAMTQETREQVLHRNALELLGTCGAK